MDMNTKLKQRRMRLGLSQTEVARRVVELVTEEEFAESFTQQSVAKLEKPGATSVYLPYVMRVLNEAEGLISIDAADDLELQQLFKLVSGLAPEDRSDAARHLELLQRARKAVLKEDI